MADKYLKTGALNPAWCDEQDAEAMTEDIVGSLRDIFETDDFVDSNIELELGPGVKLNISKKTSNVSNKCDIIDIPESDYEAKFKFIKNHSSDPDDLKLAREIIGLKN